MEREKVTRITTAGISVETEKGKDYRFMVDVLQDIAEYTLHVGKFRHSQLIMPHDAIRIQLSGIDIRIRLEEDSFHTCYMHAMRVLAEKGKWFVAEGFTYPALLVYIGRYISRYVYSDIISAIAYVKDCTLDGDTAVLYSIPDESVFSNYEVSLILESIRQTFDGNWKLVEAVTDNVYQGYTTREVCRMYGIGSHRLNDAKKRLREMLA